MHANDEGLYTRYAGKNPPAGAMISFYQAAPGANAPSIEILDASGTVIRHVRGTTRVNEREIPIVTNFAGINRVTWDLREDGPVRWDGAAKETYKGPRTGLVVMPGAYSVRIALAGKTFTQPLRVEQDPRVTIAAGDVRAAYAFAKRHLAEYSQLDATLNRLDAYAASAGTAAAASGGELAAALRTLREKALELRGRLTADFTNDEDFIGRPGRIREDLQGLAGLGYAATSGPPTAAQREYAGRVDAALAAVLRDIAAFERGDVARADAALKAAGKGPLATSGAKRTDVVGGEATGEDD
jgi:hypothetical protein